MNGPRIKLVALEQLILHRYDNGVVECVHQWQDQHSRRMIPHQMFRTMDDHQDPFTNADLLFIAACELVATELGYNYQLPF